MRDGAGDQGQSRDKGQNRVETTPPCLSAVKWSGPSQEARKPEARRTGIPEQGRQAAVQQKAKAGAWCSTRGMRSSCYQRQPLASPQGLLRQKRTLNGACVGPVLGTRGKRL